MNDDDGRTAQAGAGSGLSIMNGDDKGTSAEGSNERDGD